MTRGLSCTLLTRVSQVASPRKSAKMRLERVQKINKVSRSLFGPVIKSEFRSYAQMEMTKYQLQAANKWSFDFTNESPISSESSQYKWDTVKLPDVPKFYHHIVNPNKLQASSSESQLFDECENICPFSHNINASIKSRQKIVISSTTNSNRNVCMSQTKITDYLKIRKRRLSTTSAVCLKKARAEL
ncbi:hypothetical protein PVAND_010369 [Polypedilum vanderplanki]|uniref:Cyclin-dependent kinase inhibitor domain-containing protein n=1 Tax=Polypedilum vanderplanki TaxID=319348 RepID=A0A9J6CFG5_POLVA|nr:hypothetical protein PVAND_010369 [Polypedilum vanderplanki]